MKEIYIMLSKSRNVDFSKRCEIIVIYTLSWNLLKDKICPTVDLDPSFSSPLLSFVASSSQFLHVLILHFYLSSKTIISQQNQGKSIFYNQYRTNLLTPSAFSFPTFSICIIFSKHKLGPGTKTHEDYWAGPVSINRLHVFLPFPLHFMRLPFSLLY